MTNFIPVAITLLILWGGLLSANNSEYMQLIEDANYIVNAAHLRNQEYETLIRQVSPSVITPENPSQSQPIDTINTMPSFYHSLSEVMNTKANEYLLLYQTSPESDKLAVVTHLQDLKSRLQDVLSPSSPNLTAEEVSQNYVELESIESLTSIPESQIQQEIADTITYIDSIIDQIHAM